MEELGLPELTNNEIQRLCEEGEKAAWNHITSKVPKNMILDLDITIDVEGVKPLSVVVEVELSLSPLARVDEAQMAREAAEKASARIEELLREIACNSKS